MMANSQWWELIIYGVISLIVCVGASNIINFMDGINGITGAYAMASLIPLYILNNGVNGGFVDNSFIITMMLADVVFCFFNFRPRGKAKCFAGDVGSLGGGVYLVVPDWQQGDANGRYHILDIPGGVWRGWCTHYLSSHHAAREPWTGA